MLLVHIARESANRPININLSLYDEIDDSIAASGASVHSSI